MTVYRTSTKIKLGLIAAAVAIAVASLWVTERLADRLEAQDGAAVELWARAIEFQYHASYETLAAGSGALDTLREALERLPEAERPRAAAALDALADGSQGSGLDFVFNEIVEADRFSVPAVITDSALTSVSGWRNVEGVGDGRSPEEQARLLALARDMDAVNAPIRVEGGPGLVQFVHYGESPLARLTRLFPIVQLAVVGLFVLVGYLGFSYVRRSEQSSLWVGMAREAAHQLGTPLSSMIGWIEVLRLGDADLGPARVADELDRDVERLRRVADRFEKIGTTPELRPTPVRPVLESVADYIRRRVPQRQPVTIQVEAPEALAASLNVELFEWVIENLLKNALDAMEGVPPPSDGHRIDLRAQGRAEHVVVEVRDTGKGMDRATARHVFRPGFSTKRRGWGLGLSLARRIVESYHGGTLEVAATRPGAGTTFRLTLDAARRPERPPEP